MVRALLAWLLLVPLLLALGGVWKALCNGLGIELAAEQDVLARLRELERPAWIQALLVAVLVAPLLEEIVFRGFLQRCFVGWLGPSSGVIASAVLFAVGFHDFSVFLPLFALALLLGALRQATDSLWPSILVHAASNGSNLALVLLFPEWRESPS
jgi:membrane protease YdiL (CAAX protease family)